MELVLYNEKTSAIQPVTVTTLDELYDLIEVYFSIDRKRQTIKFNGKQLDTTKNLLDVGLVHGDMLVISEPNNNTTDIEAPLANAMDDHMDNMMIQSQIAHTLVYMKAEYNDIAFKVMIDSGAQTSVMAKYMAEFLGISHLIDTRMAGVAKGVGTTKILGCIFGCNIKINDNMFVPVNLKILDNDFDNHLVLLGLDFLYSHGCVFDFKNRSLKINEQSVQFMNEVEVNEYKDPFNIRKENIKKQFNEMISKIPFSQKTKILEMLKKIINNIIDNPNDEKFKSINTESSIFKESLAKYQECITFMKKIGFTVMSDGKFKFTNGTDILNYTNEIMSA